MASQNPQTAEDIIPLLEDSADEQAHTEGARGRNPFLPYEHLERLAREREEFNRQFAELMQQRVQSARAMPQHTTTPSVQDARHPDLERIIHVVTQKVIAEYLPQIEQRIRADVIRHLNSLDFSSDNS
ncbi:MAG: hypothetical protein D6758_02950 [Gammaproteobacteria bacterium]|nr:MAG: hypothetical protein D6758_02950 [Gammaproteobacteria bacterium]